MPARRTRRKSPASHESGDKKFTGDGQKLTACRPGIAGSAAEKQVLARLLLKWRHELQQKEVETWKTHGTN